MQTVVETPSCLRAASIFSEAERADIVAMVAADLECGEVMQGTGGFRKVRVGRDGIGKRGGARVIYILRSVEFPIEIFWQNEQTKSSVSIEAEYDHHV